MSHSRVKHPGESPLDWLQDLHRKGWELEGVWDMHITIVKVDFNYIILTTETEGRSGGEGEKRKWSGEVVKWERRREKKGGEE